MTERIEDILKLMVYPVLVYLNIDKTVIGILCILMILDSVAGGIKSWRVHHEFSGKKFIWGYVLKVLMLLIPAVLALVGKALGYDFRVIVDTVIKIMIVSEAYSIFGNYYAAKNRVDVQRLDIVSMILVAVRKRMHNAIQVGLDSIVRGGNCNNTKDDEDNK